METPATKWQPIATAPRDTPILVTDGGIIVVVERGKYWRGLTQYGLLVFSGTIGSGISGGKT